MAMRGLPELSYGTPVARPQGVVTDPQAGSAWAAVADASEAVGALFKKRAVEEAGLEGEKVGRQLAKGEVARDESGKLQIQRPHLRDADAAFMLAAKTAYLSGTSLDIKTEVAKARAVHADDVEGFRAAVDGIAQSHLGNLEFPEWAGDIEEMIGREAGAHLNGIISAKMQRDMQRSASAVTAKLADNANDLYALSEQGQLQSEEGQRLLNETIEIFNSKVSNPAFNYSPEQADLEIREFRSELEARALVGEAERIFKTEGAESAAKWLDQQINDTSLELDPATRDKIETQGLKRINDLAQAQNAAATEARDLKYTEMNLRAEMGRLSVKQVNDALAKGEITPAAARSLHDKVIKDTTEDVGLTEALGRLASGMPMDPQNATDRKAANVAFDSLVKRGIDPLQATVNMAVTNGIIPDKPMSMIRGAGLSNDPRVVAGGYNAGVAVIENAPDAFDRMPGGDAMARDVEQYRHLTRDLGFSEQDAAGRIIQQRDPAFRRQAEAVLDVERPNISKLTSDDAMAAMGARGTGFFGSLYNLYAEARGIAPDAGFTPGQSAQMAADYRAFVIERLKETGDLQSAKNVAGEDMRRNYGVTSVFGETTLMKYPPERRYPKVNGGWDYIKAQAVEDARQIMGGGVNNLPAATRDLNLTPQEQFLYQHHLNNLNSGKSVKNADGSVSTVRVATEGIDGRAYTLPTVWDGKILTDAEEIVNRAAAVGLDKFPSYATGKEADARYDAIHKFIERDKAGKDTGLTADDVVLLPDSVTANDWARQGQLPRYGIGIRTTVNGAETIVTLPSGYFVADPKRAGATPNTNAEEFAKGRAKAFSIEKALKGAREAGPVY